MFDSADLFITPHATLAGSSSWQTQQPRDDYDIVSRVFHLNPKYIMMLMKSLGRSGAAWSLWSGRSEVFLADVQC